MKKHLTLICLCLWTALFPDALLAAIELESTNQPPGELFALIFGGAGIFLVGIHFAGDYLQQMTSGTVSESR
jgi:hypothetical protein